MTDIEAKELLDNLIGMIEDSQGNDYDTALRLSIKALEKQIPIAPYKVNDEALKLDGIFDWCCGKCGTHHRNDFLLNYCNYCSECGQALVWE